MVGCILYYRTFDRRNAVEIYSPGRRITGRGWPRTVQVRRPGVQQIGIIKSSKCPCFGSNSGRSFCGVWCFVVATGAARSSMRRRWVRCFMTSMRSRRVGRECTSCAHRSARWADSHADSGLALRDGPKSLSKKAWRSATKLLARDRTESAVVPHKCKTMCLDTQPRNKNEATLLLSRPS